MIVVDDDGTRYTKTKYIEEREEKPPARISLTSARTLDAHGHADWTCVPKHSHFFVELFDIFSFSCVE